MIGCDVYLLQNSEDKSLFKWGISVNAEQRVKAIPGYTLRRKVRLRTRGLALKLENRLRGWTLYRAYNRGPSGEYFQIFNPKSLAKAVATFWPKQGRTYVSRIETELGTRPLRTLSRFERRAEYVRRHNRVPLWELMEEAVNTL